MEHRTVAEPHLAKCNRPTPST